MRECQQYAAGACDRQDAEFVIRAALGAGQWRLLRQSLTESVLLALAGGGLGLVLAALGPRAALNVLPTGLPRADEVGLDARVLLFTAAISVFTGVLAGLAPALKTSQWRLSETLKEGGRGASGGRARARGVLVAMRWHCRSCAHRRGPDDSHSERALERLIGLSARQC